MALPLPRVVPDVGPGGSIVTSMNGINALANAMLKTKYYAPNIQSEINYRNELVNKLKTMTPLEAAELSLKNQFYGPSMESEINNRNALTEKYNTMTPLEAKELQLKNQFYPEEIKSQINYRNTGGAGMGVAQKELRGFENQLSLEHPNWSPEQINQAASAYITGTQVMPDGTRLPPISGLGQTFVDNIIKRGTTAGALNQQRFAATTDALLKEGNRILPIVAQYAGLLGDAKGNIDSVKSSLGANNPAYQDYIYFTRTLVPATAGEMMRALGVNASDTQKALYQQVINPFAWDQNPAGAIQNYKRMQELFENTVSKTVGQSTGELRAGLRGNNQNKSSEKPDVEPYATDYNKPVGSQPMMKDGELYFIPSNQVKDAVKKGYTYAK